MLPPVLEIHVIWHPADDRGHAIAEEFVQHFHGTVFSGLIGGAIEVYIRSEGWQSVTDAPRPISFEADDSCPSIRPAQFFAIVPILGNELAAAVEPGSSSWGAYLDHIVQAHQSAPDQLAVFPYLLDPQSANGTRLGTIFERYQRIGANPLMPEETATIQRCRDLTQGIFQHLTQATNERLTVFISHTKRYSPGEHEDVEGLIEAVREVIRGTRLGEFFDASDLQPGRDWDNELRRNAATSALLAIRTDLYASREWCQREMLIAKRAAMPVIIMDALGHAEERGSFLMDHVPRIPTQAHEGRWRRCDIHRALSLLVDECLKRALWWHQEQLARREIGFDIAWWAPHAPEPITLIKWLQEAADTGELKPGEDLLVLHPDPPLGPDEKTTLQEILDVGGFGCRLDVMTPRLLASRGG